MAPWHRFVKVMLQERTVFRAFDCDAIRGTSRNLDARQRLACLTLELKLKQRGGRR